jgi:hypothetical protein
VGVFASLIGVTLRYQRAVERGLKTPNGNYLAALVSLRLDVVFILSGTRNVSLRSKTERELLLLFRQAPLVARSNVVQALISTDEICRPISCNISIGGTSVIAYRDVYAGHDITTGRRILSDKHHVPGRGRKRVPDRPMECRRRIEK